MGHILLFVMLKYLLDICDFSLSNWLELCSVFHITYCISRQSRGYLGISTVAPSPQRFFSCTISEQLFDITFSNLVCGYILRILTSSLNLGLGLQIICQWRPLNCQIWGFLTHFGPVLEKRRAHDLNDHKYDTYMYICPL